MKNKIKNLLIEALEKNFAKEELIKLVEVQQATAKHIKADYFSNIAMKLSKVLKKDPMEIAKDILKDIKENDLCAYDIARPGYINFIIKDIKIQKTQIIKNKHILIFFQNDFSTNLKGICFNCINSVLIYIKLTYIIYYIYIYTFFFILTRKKRKRN